MDVTAINRDPALHRTPLGRIFVAEDRDGALNVFVDDGKSPPRCIHVVEPGGNVFDALYGKHPLMAAEIRQRYADRDHEKARARQAQREDEARQMTTGLLKLLRRDREGTLAAMANFMGNRPARVP
jgi:hypothetical protein